MVGGGGQGSHKQPQILIGEASQRNKEATVKKSRGELEEVVFLQTPKDRVQKNRAWHIWGCSVVPLAIKRTWKMGHLLLTIRTSRQNNLSHRGED